MQMRELGRQGPVVSAVGLGGNNFGRAGRACEDGAGTAAVLDAALESGITMIDTAEMYNDGRSEELIGQWLKGRRDQVQVATKFGHVRARGPQSQDWGPCGSAGYVRKACEASLRRLDTEVIDLYQQHTPDPETPVLETLTALQELIDEGKVRNIGHSNFNAAQMREADEVARREGLTPFVCAQNEYSLLQRGVEGEDLDTMRELGLGLVPFFPLASGLLTGKYRRDHRPEGARLSRREDLDETTDWEQLEAYSRVCEEYGVSELRAAIGWLLAKEPVSSVIAGATRPEQVRANAACGQDLPAELVARLDALFAP